MKIVKIIFITLSSLIICFLLFAFIASFSFENTFYNKTEDSTILFIKEKDKTSYKYSIKDNTLKINFVKDSVDDSVYEFKINYNSLTLKSKDNNKGTFELKKVDTNRWGVIVKCWSIEK